MFWKLKIWYSNIYAKIYDCQMKRKYPDYEANEYNSGDLKFIWAVKSWDDFSGKDANIYTMNDIEINYNRKTNEYILSIETAYVFEDERLGEIHYLEELLKAFTKFMTDNNYNTNEPFFYWAMETDSLWKAESIPLLYTQFKLFVEGYKAICGDS